MSSYSSNEQDITTSAPLKPDWLWVRGSWMRLLAFGFGSGLSHRAPGTMGTVFAIPLYVLMQSFLPWIVIFALTVPLFVLGTWICDQVSQELGVKDHGGIVWDEIVSFLLVLSLVFNHRMSLLAMVISLLSAFILFRFFDIVKPFPIRTLERRIPGGLGIMADDLFAAIYTLIVFHLGWGALNYL